jgi:hypothetical protein
MPPPRSLQSYHFDPPADPAAEAEGTLADRLIRLACLSYGEWHPSHAEAARRLLAEQPELARADIHTAATIGDVAVVRALLAADPTLATSRGGAFEWEPLLYACYSRLDHPDHSTLEVARVLLAHGADPDAGFLWRGNVPPFTALTGAFGDGEAGANQPPHQHQAALARLLLDAGADPNDGQTLYNRHFVANDDHLVVLFEYGLGQDRCGPWYQRLGDRLQSPAQLLVEELWCAARKDYRERARLLVEHGAEVNARGVRDKRTPYEAALLCGNHELAAFLAEHGATPVVLGPDDAFALACITGDRVAVKRRLAEDPRMLERLGPGGQIRLVHRAVEANHPDGIRLMHELGFALDGTTRHDSVGINLEATPMHNAAWAGNLPLVELLVELGANPHLREANHQATPIGFAHYNRQHHVVAFLMQHATIFEAIAADGVERVDMLLREDPSLATATEDGKPLASFVHDGLTRRDAMIEVLRAHGVDLGARGA